MEKVTRAQGEYAKVNVDFKEGDLLKILDAGQVVTGEYGDKHVFKVETKNGERNLSFNQTSVNNLVEAFGEESDTWIGKTIKAFVVRQMVGDGLKNVVYLTAEDWEMTDDGKFVKAA